VTLSAYKHAAKLVRATQKANYQSVILLIFKKIKALRLINVENRKKHIPAIVRTKKGSDFRQKKKLTGSLSPL